MRYVFIIMIVILPGIASADWYYLDPNANSNEPNLICTNLGAKMTPQESLGKHLGNKSFKTQASYTFTDNSEMLALSAKDSLFVYVNNIASCKALWDSLKGLSGEEIFVVGMCDKPTRTGTIEFEIASALIRHGNDRLKIVMQNKWGGMLKLTTDDGKIAPIFISSTKEYCLHMTDVSNKLKKDSNKIWYAVNQGRNSCIISPMSPANRLELIQEAGLKPEIRESNSGGNLVSVEISVIDGSRESRWVFWKDRTACEKAITRVAIPDSYR